METINFAKKMHYQKIGFAFCAGLSKEARIVSGLFEQHGFNVSSVCCKNAAIPKEELGLTEEQKLRPGEWETMCNPIGQAMLLNHDETEFNVMMGLCVGHDSVFLHYAEAMTTVLAAKDRALAHNPIGAIYCDHYFSSKLAPNPENPPIDD